MYGKCMYAHMHPCMNKQAYLCECKRVSVHACVCASTCNDTRLQLRQTKRQSEQQYTVYIKTYVIPVGAQLVCARLGVVDVLKASQQRNEGGCQQTAAHTVVIVMVTETSETRA